jgi:hypothetical protein
VQGCWGAVALLPFLSQSLHVTWPRRERSAPVVAYACGFGAAIALEHAIPTTAGLLLSLPAGTLAYVAAFVLSGGVNGRDRRRLAEIIERAKSWRDRRPAPSIPDAAEG